MDEVAKAAVLGLAVETTLGLVHSKPHVTPEMVPEILRSVHSTLVDLYTAAEPPAKPDTETGLMPPGAPAVPIKKSITPDFIICLEDGNRYKSLKRHLMSAYGLTPEQYRKRWNLPADYPMTAPRYSEKRSELAKASGLGQKV